MVDVVKLQPEHIVQLARYATADDILRDIAQDERRMGFLCSDISYAGLRDGVAIAASGVMEQWPGRALAWFWPVDVKLREWPAVTRIVYDGIEQCRRAGIRRLEISVADGHRDGHRWAQRLGFNPDALLEAYLPGGMDAWLYSIVFPADAAETQVAAE